MGRRVAMYFAWDRPREVSAPIGLLEDRFPALFEIRRLYYPELETLADPKRYDQLIDGFIDNIFLNQYRMFVLQTASLCGDPVQMIQRETVDGRVLLSRDLLATIDTLIVVSFDSHVTKVRPEPSELAAITEFLTHPNHTVFVCPHHSIGDMDGILVEAQQGRKIAEFRHHGDRAIPPRQLLGGFGVHLLMGLGFPIQNRFGLKPAHNGNGEPAPINLCGGDRFRLFEGVTTLNLHPHLPHFERLGGEMSELEVLVRQTIDPTAPPHPAFSGNHTEFDSVLQARSATISGCLLVGDTTLWSSTFGGLESLQRFWKNVALQDCSETNAAYPDTSERRYLALKRNCI
jgi:hypothetical protein